MVDLVLRDSPRSGGSKEDDANNSGWECEVERETSAWSGSERTAVDLLFSGGKVVVCRRVVRRGRGTSFGAVEVCSNNANNTVSADRSCQNGAAAKRRSSTGRGQPHLQQAHRVLGQGSTHLTKRMLHSRTRRPLRYPRDGWRNRSA